MVEMRIAIIGGAGWMGAWFARLFAESGHDVTISGRHYEKCAKLAKRLHIHAAKTNREAIKGADLIIVSVLVSQFGKVIKEIAPRLEPGQKIIDITSVKILPVKIMHKYIKRNQALGTHPMFGPSANPEGQNCILTPTNASERKFARDLGKFLRKYKFNVLVLTPEKHDEMIGAVLSLTHFVGLVIADTWKTLKIERYMKTSGTSFRFLMQFAKSVVDSSPELYAYLQMEVPHAIRNESVFVKRAEKLIKMNKALRKIKFQRNMEELSAYINSLES